MCAIGFLRVSATLFDRLGQLLYSRFLSFNPVRSFLLGAIWTNSQVRGLAWLAEASRGGPVGA